MTIAEVSVEGFTGWNLANTYGATEVSRRGTAGARATAGIPSGMTPLLLLLAALATHANDTAAVMARGVSHDLARQRASRLADVRYDLRLDLTRADTAYGRVRISFSRRDT